MRRRGTPGTGKGGDVSQHDDGWRLFAWGFLGNLEGIKWPLLECFKIIDAMCHLVPATGSANAGRFRVISGRDN